MEAEIYHLYQRAIKISASCDFSTIQKGLQTEFKSNIKTKQVHQCYRND